MTAPITEWFRKKRAEMIAKFGGECQNCGSRLYLQFAHEMNGVGRGSHRRIRDVMDHPDNYVLLCRNCHLDHGSKNGHACYAEGRWR